MVQFAQCVRYDSFVDFSKRMHAQWKEISPDTNADSILSIGRIVRIASIVNMITGEVAERHGLTRGEFELIAAIRRSGKNCRATELSVLTKSSGAAITKRLDKLSAMGFVTREVLPRDRRVVLVNITEEGRELIDVLVPTMFHAELEFLSGLTQDEIVELQVILEKLLNSIEPSVR